MSGVIWPIVCTATKGGRLQDAADLAATLHCSDLLVTKPDNEARPVGRRRDLFVKLAAILRNARRIERKLGPAALLRLVGQHIDQGLGDAFAAVVMMHINMIDLTGAHAGNRLGKIVENNETDEMAIKARTGDFRCTVTQKVFRIVIVRTARRATFQRLGIAGQQRGEFMGIAQMQRVKCRWRVRQLSFWS